MKKKSLEMQCLVCTLPNESKISTYCRGGKTEISTVYYQARNLEKRFGEICEFGKNIRSIEGDCVNLGSPSRGAAGQALRRLARHDPAFPDGAGFVPSGATDISPRLISNLVCQQSK